MGQNGHSKKSLNFLTGAFGEGGGRVIDIGGPRKIVEKLRNIDINILGLVILLPLNSGSGHNGAGLIVIFPKSESKSHCVWCLLKVKRKFLQVQKGVYQLFQQN
jgi:hypothetical protein